MRRSTDRLKLPTRITSLLDEAQALEKQGFFISAMLGYSRFLEQALLAAYILRLKKTDPRYAKGEIDRIMAIKDSKNLTFGTVLDIVKRVFDAQTIKLSRKVKKIRDELVAHPFFVMPLDPTNRHKLAMYDVNNYRKIVRRLLRLLEDKSSLIEKDWLRIEDFLKRGSPLARIGTLEQDASRVENIILRQLCRCTREKVRLAYVKLRQSLVGSIGLDDFVD